MQHVQSAAPQSCRVHAPSCLVLTEHGLEIAQLVLGVRGFGGKGKGVKETAAGALPTMCTEM